jgi:hypothetical protein
MMRKIVIASALLPLSSACVAIDPIPADGPCPVTSAGNWRAWVDLMPGAKQTLNVVGQVTVPSGGYRVWLERGGLQEIHPPVQQMILRAQPPSGGATGALVTHEVQASFPATANYGAVVVRCGSDIIAEIRPVGAAH